MCAPVIENNQGGDSREDNSEESTHQCTRASGEKHMRGAVADMRDLISIGWLEKKTYEGREKMKI